MEQQILAGLDIGTTKVCVVIGQKTTEDLSLVILGVGEVACTGVRKGSIVNIEVTAQAIIKAIESAELMAGIEIDKLYVNISNTKVKGQNRKGIIAISNREKEILEQEIIRVVEAAQIIPMPSDESILHVIPWNFRIDDQDDIRDPIGMTGVRLESDVHIITTQTSAIQNTKRCIERCGLVAEDIILSAIASAEVALTKEERLIGTLLIDIGGGTSDAIAMINESVYYTRVFPVGGQNITHDISVGLKVPEYIAEQIKLNYGQCEHNESNVNKVICIPEYGSRKSQTIESSLLSEIIQPRIKEIFNFIYNDIVKKNHLEQISSVVLTGGSSLLKQIQEAAQDIFNLPIRVGKPDMEGGLKDKIDSPAYTTASGLVLYGLKNEENVAIPHSKGKQSIFQRARSSIRDFTKEFFT